MSQNFDIVQHSLSHLNHNGRIDSNLRENRKEGDATLFFSDGARCSIDSTFEFRHSDLVDVEAARPMTEIVITPSSLDGVPYDPTASAAASAERRRRSLPRVIVEENSSSVDRFATTTTATDDNTTEAEEETEPESSSSFDREGFSHLHH